MKALKIKQLAEKDEEIADILISLGMSRNMAMSLTYLQNMNSATSMDLERVVRLRQPEVSITMKQLREREWIDEREEKMPGKGRPYKVCLLYTSDAADEEDSVDLGGRRIIKKK